jgi:hypothetical protein
LHLSYDTYSGTPCKHEIASAHFSKKTYYEACFFDIRWPKIYLDDFKFENPELHRSPLDDENERIQYALEEVEMLGETPQSVLVHNPPS